MIDLVYMFSLMSLEFVGELWLSKQNDKFLFGDKGGEVHWTI